MRETYNKISVIRKWHYDLAVHIYNEKIADRCLSQRKLTITSLFPHLFILAAEVLAKTVRNNRAIYTRKNRTRLK